MDPKYEIKLKTAKAREELASHPRVLEVWGEQVQAEIRESPLGTWLYFGRECGWTLADACGEVENTDFRDCEDQAGA